MSSTDAKSTSSHSPVFTKEERQRYSKLAELIRVPLYYGMVGGFLVHMFTGNKNLALVIQSITFLYVILLPFVFMFTRLTLMRRFRRTVEDKCESEYGLDLSNAPHVGISPGPRGRNYSGETSWDIGFLVFEEGRIAYYGDRSAFEFRPEQIIDVQFKPNWELPGFGYPRLSISWRDQPQASPEFISLSTRDARSILGMWKLTKSLHCRIEEWRQASSSAVQSDTTLGLPPLYKDVRADADLYDSSSASGCLGGILMGIPFGVIITVWAVAALLLGVYVSGVLLSLLSLAIWVFVVYGGIREYKRRKLQDEEE